MLCMMIPKIYLRSAFGDIYVLVKGITITVSDLFLD